MSDTKPPRMLDFGFGEMVELSYLQRVFGVSRRTASKYLKAFRIKPMYFGKEVFFSLPTLKRILFVLSKPDGLGFVAPGSTAKNNPRICQNPAYLFEVTNDILEKASDPRIAAEMMACEGRDSSIIKQFITKPIGRPMKKEKQNETTPA